MTFGSYVYSDPAAVLSFTFGKGVSPTQYLVNTKANSFMVSFNSDLPTLFVGPASGLGTIGKVGIGTNIPEAKLEVVSEVANAYSYAFKAVVSNSLTKAISIVDNSAGTPVENFLVYGNGQVYCREIFVKLGILGDFVFRITHLVRKSSFSFHLGLKSCSSEVSETRNLNSFFG
jgi:hypothetical protein